MEFCWDNFKKKKYTDIKDKLDKRAELADDYIGSVRVGEICVDVLIRDYGEGDTPKYAYSYDFYVANEDTGYGYRLESNIPYDYADGTDLTGLALSYDEFVKKSEELLTSFIKENDKVKGYSLIEKANKPLLIW